MVRSQRRGIKVTEMSHIRRRIDVSEESFQFIASQLRYPEELGDTLDRILESLKK